MENLLTGLIVFILVFVFYLIFVVFNKKKRDKIFESAEAILVSKRFNVELKNVSKKFFAVGMSICDTIIITATFIVMSFIKNIYISFLVAIPTIFVMIIICYFIFGNICKKKEGKKNV